jgi:DNA processing protein
MALQEMSFLTLAEKLLFAGKVERVEDFEAMSPDDFSLALGRKVRARIWQPRTLVNRMRLARRIMEGFAVRALVYGDGAYPELLANIFDPPFVLFVRGDAACLSAPCISVVGTRKPAPEGMEAARSFARDAARAGCTVVSGLAFGIDACAHSGALSAPGGKTAAVLASGVDVISPMSNRRLGGRILERGGCIVSEYLPGAGALAWRFVMRNRIIAGLSRATVVVDAPGKSGALITAKDALNEGRDVYVHRVSVDRDAASPDAERFAPLMAMVRDGAPVVGSYGEIETAEAPSVNRSEGLFGEEY